MYSEYKIVVAKDLAAGELEKTLNEYAKDGWRIVQVIQASGQIILDRLAGEIQGASSF